MSQHPAVVLAHTILRSYHEGNLLKDFLSRSDPDNEIYSSALNRLESWLLTWKVIGGWFRVGGLDYVVAENRFIPGPNPKNIYESVQRTHEANRLFRDFLTELPERGEPIDEQISSCVATLDLLQTSLMNLLDDMGSGQNGD